MSCLWSRMILMRVSIFSRLLSPCKFWLRAFICGGILLSLGREVLRETEPIANRPAVLRHWVPDTRYSVFFLFFCPAFLFLRWLWWFGLFGRFGVRLLDTEDTFERWSSCFVGGKLMLKNKNCGKFRCVRRKVLQSFETFLIFSSRIFSVPSISLDVQFGLGWLRR